MPVGVHVSIGGGICRAIERARELECETVQFFGHNPRGWRVAPIPQGEVEGFKAGRKGMGLEPAIIHASYLINLASPEESIFKRSVELFVKELEIGEMLEVDFVVVHPGSTRGRDSRYGIRRVREAISLVCKKKPELRTGILLENTSGCGYTLGSQLGELKEIIDGFNNRDIGICFDTCHGYAAGYPMETVSDVNRLVGTIDAEVGLQYLALMHLNDSKGSLGSRIDRHQHIGYGKIGLGGFRALLNHSSLKDIPMILETPKKSARDDLNNLNVIRKLTDK